MIRSTLAAAALCVALAAGASAQHGGGPLNADIAGTTPDGSSGAASGTTDTSGAANPPPGNPPPGRRTRSVQTPGPGGSPTTGTAPTTPAGVPNCDGLTETALVMCTAAGGTLTLPPAPNPAPGPTGAYCPPGCTCNAAGAVLSCGQRPTDTPTTPASAGPASRPTDGSQPRVSELGAGDNVIGAGNGADGAGTVGRNLPGGGGEQKPLNSLTSPIDPPDTQYHGVDGGMADPSLGRTLLLRDAGHSKGGDAPLAPNPRKPIWDSVVTLTGAAFRAKAPVSDQAKLASAQAAQAARTARQPGLLFGLDDVRKELLGHHWDVAAERASRWLNLNPDDPKALTLRAEALNHMKRYSDAERDAKRATRLDPKNGRAWLNLAEALRKQGKNEEALAAADRAVALRGDAASYGRRALIRQALGRRADALADLRLAARLDPPHYAAKLAAAEAGGAIADDTETTLDDSDEAQPAGREYPFWALLAGAAGVVFFVTCWLVFVDPKAFSRLEARLQNLRAAPPEPFATPAPAAPARVAAVPRLIGGRYAPGRELARSGLGAVSEGEDRAAGEKVALKNMTQALGPLGPQGRETFVKRSRALLAVSHPKLAALRDVVQEGAEVVLVSELAPGRSLSALIAQGPFTLERALAVMQPVCEALDHAHGRGLVHRDVKPANILVAEDGSVKVTDFGVAHALSDAFAVHASGPFGHPATDPLASLRQRVIGTPPYLALEAEGGTARPESDVYSLAVCLYEMLTGRTPFTASASISERIAGQYPKASTLVDLPEDFDALLAACLDSRIDKRLPSAGRFLAALKKAYALR